MGARFSARVQTGLGAHPASYTMGTGSFPEVKNGRGVLLTATPSNAVVKKEKSYTSTALWALQPVQSLSACKSVHFTFYHAE